MYQNQIFNFIKKYLFHHQYKTPMNISVINLTGTHKSDIHKDILNQIVKLVLLTNNVSYWNPQELKNKGMKCIL